MMTRDEISAYCESLPGAELTEPFGEGLHVWKIGNKMFAIPGLKGDGVTFKCPDADTAAMLI